MSRKGKLPADKSGAACLYRSATVDRAAANDDDRSIPMVLATETPLDVFDMARGDIVQETLRLDGMDLPKQVPMVDSHERDSVRNVLGSIRDLKVENGQLIGRAYFSRDPESQRAFDNYKDGHLTDFSVGAKVMETQYDGSQKHVTRSRLLEGSAVVAGQDPHAKALPVAMRAYVDPHELKEEVMQKQLRDALISRGMDENASDAEAVAFVESLTTTTTTEQEEVTTVATSEEIEPPTAEEPVAEEEEVMATPTPEESVATERSRIKGIDEVCRRLDQSDEVRRGYIDSGKTAEQVAFELLRKQSEQSTGAESVGVRIESGTSEREKFYDAASNGLMRRMAVSGQLKPDQVIKSATDADTIQRNEALQQELTRRDSGADEFRFVRLPDLARMFLEKSGERTIGLPQHEIVRRAMRQNSFIERGATNTTGTFSNLLLDAANKTLLMGYDEAPYTYSQWVRQAASAPDFKTLNRIRFGEMADPEVVPENHDYPEKGTQDAKESYGVEKYGEIFSISLEAVVNDDLNAMTRIPQMQGAAMRRKINKVCYSVLTDNAALSDGIALFHASSHGANLDANALAESALDTGYSVMMNQTGLSGTGTPLGLMPSFLIVPPDLAATAYRLTGGGVVPESVGNVPLYGPGGPRPLSVVVEAQLTANSTTAWYLAASSGITETVEITFLQGEETPVLDRSEGFENDSLKYKIRQTFASKAIDYRGLYQGNS